MSPTTKDSLATKRSIPNGWQWVRLEEACEQDKQTIEPNSLTAKSLSYLSLEDVESGTGRILKEGDVGTDNNGQSTTFVFDERHVLYGKLRPYLNKVALPNFRGRCTTEMIPLLPKEGTNREFLAWLLRRGETVQVAMRQKTGSRMPRADMDDLLTLEIPLPPFTEQKRIVSILTEQMIAVDHARAAAEAQLDTVKALPDAYLRAVFNSHEAKQWPSKPLGELAVLGPDNGIFKRRHEFGVGVPIVNVSDLYRSRIVDLGSVERVQASPEEVSRYSIQPGDLFFCRSSLKREGIGWCCYVNEIREPAVFECHVMRVRVNTNKVIPEYVAHYWARPSVREEVIGNSRTATMTTMNQGDLAAVTIPVPPLEVQRRISAVLSAQITKVEQSFKMIETQLATINALPAALLRQAFSGGL